MSKTTPYQSLQRSYPGTTARSNNRQRHTRHLVAYSLWVAGLVVLFASAVTVHFHPGPWPVDLQTTIQVQHTPLAPPVMALVNLVSLINDPIASIGTMLALLVLFALIALLQRRRRQPAAGWLATGLFLSAGIAAMDGIDGLISLLVGRPRPSSPLIHIYISEPFHSFPSGHVEHDLVFYGFLLFLSLSKPVRQWPYRWVLIPLQFFAVLVIASIGYARIYEGSHWLTDVLGGYLSGALLLGLLIFLYGWVNQKIEEHRAKSNKQRF